NAHPNIVPYQSFATADGDIVVAAANDGQFQRLCAFAGAPELANDKRFKTNDQRVRNRDALVPMLQKIIAAKPSQHWLDGLEKAEVSCGPINTIKQLFDDPHVKARGMALEMPHPATGKAPVSLVASPIRMTATGPDYRHAPPLLGQHTEEVLKEVLGMKAGEIAALRKKGVV
ncbi:MAG: CoA transferase, partial [Rhodospirillales bacterium]|nr:CoA transferase [Rhodospirillales bacterium]